MLPANAEHNSERITIKFHITPIQLNMTQENTEQLHTVGF